MAVFRVERNTGYTVMSNHHLRNKELSLKAKGLLSQMLSLPEDWDYTLSGLSYINRESIDAIRTAVWELEKAGYITRRQGRDEKGKMTAIEYTIYEQPQPPELDCPVLENPTADNPILENPTTDNPTSENPMQLNKDISRTNLPKKEKSNTDLSITHSIPIHSLNPLPYGEDEAAQPPERKRAERNDAYRVYEEIIKDNIEYDILLQDMKFDHDRLNEIVDIILETVCTSRKKIRIAGDDYPAELVKSKFMKLSSEHIRFVLDCISDISHQLKTPLAALNIYNGIIQGEAKELPTIQEFSQLSEQELDRIETLVQSLLKITKLDAGTIILEKSLENVSELAKNIKKHFLFRAEQEGKEICLSGNEEIKLLCDRNWIIEAISNLVKNALDHTEKGGLIRIEWRAFTSIVQISVKDNGSGIHPDDLYHIFKRFYRSRFSKDTQGIGLGLSLTKAIVEAHNGTIEVDSTVGMGTSFTINFLNPTKL